jgi:quinol-cytochrome oxidoreductase complex cytochrome b subunit
MAVWKFHSPFLDDVKAKGLGPALLFKVNESVERFTAGLDIEDIRSMLRGDPPPRPNPRVKPHADGFWFHMRPTFYHNLTVGVYPTFQLGWLSVYFFAFEIVTGLFLMIFYTPSPLVAYENMLNILGNVPFGRLMRDMHKLGAEMMVIVVSLHMLRTFVTGSYKKPRQFTWFTGVILLLVTLLLSFSGYLLPWDQLSLWAVTIGASMVEAVQPQALGDALNLIVRGGPQFNEGGLLRWYLAHILLLPLVGIIFTGVHYYKVVIHGHGLPPEAEPVGEDTAKRVPMDQRTYFMPDILTNETLLFSLVTAGMVIASVFLYHAPLEPHADPLVTPLHTTAPWYFLFIQGMLKLGDKFFWGIIAPGIVTNALLVLPYLEVGPSRRYGDRRVGLTGGLLFIAVLAILSYMGTPRYAVLSSADQEILAELVPQTHPGIVRQTNWFDLKDSDITADNPTGLAIYKVEEWDKAPTAGLRTVLHEFHELLEEQALQTDPNKKLKNSEFELATSYEGEVIVERWAPDLKRVQLRITVDGGPGTEAICQQGAKNEYCLQLFVHRNSSYRQGP